MEECTWFKRGHVFFAGINNKIVLEDKALSNEESGVILISKLVREVG